MNNYDKIHEQYELCKSYYLKIDRFFQQSFDISQSNRLLIEKKYNYELNKLSHEFRACYINLHLLTDNYSKQYIKLNVENVQFIKTEIEKYKNRIDNIINLCEKQI